MTTNAPSVQDVAQWMISEIRRNGYLEQEFAATEIERRFGKDFVYINENGNLAIGREILDAFRILTEKEVVWDPSEYAWRTREKHDPPGRRAE